MNKTLVPYRLDTETVRTQVCAERMGSYMLGRDQNGFVPGYVGRSDSSLAHRLAYHNLAREYDYFVFQYADSVKEAFYQECHLYHLLDFTGVEMSNQIHPAAPRGSALKCPLCSFGKDMRRSFAW